MSLALLTVRFFNDTELYAKRYCVVFLNAVKIETKQKLIILC